jgi:hypothetical protein
MTRFLLSPVLALVAALCSVLGLAPAPALAANILVVSDANTDTNIASVLRADGHTVTLVSNDYGTGNAALRADLSAYDSVFWSATTSGFGYGNHSDPTLFSHLTDYVAGGGRMFVTGYQSLGTPDPLLIAFVGGTSVNSYPGGPGAISGIESSLTVGPAGDLRGVTPMQYSYDLDAVVGLMADTVEIAGSMPGYGGGSGGSQWTLRTVGSGEIAYVSNGDYSAAEPYSWTVPTPGAAGAYNAAIRNFAAASSPTPGISMTTASSARTPACPRTRSPRGRSTDRPACGSRCRRATASTPRSGPGRSGCRTSCRGSRASR